MVLLSTKYVLVEQRKKIIGFIIVKSKGCLDIPFKNQHQDKVKIFAVFFDRMLSERVQSEEYICGILSKKIASWGFRGNGRFPQLNLPSAVAVAKQVYRFLFADWGVSDCFP